MVDTAAVPLAPNTVSAAKRQSDVVAALIEDLSISGHVENFLAGLARLAVGEVDAASSCGLSVRGVPIARLLAATSDDLARRMDGTQYQVHQGPCMTALGDNTIVEVPDIAADARWPSFGERGRAENAGACLSIPLAVGEQAIGAFNLYARTAGAFTSAARARAELLAEQAAAAVSVAARMIESEEQCRHLRIALSSRSMIDRATGVLMGRHHLTAEAAFNLMSRQSQNTNVKFRGGRPNHHGHHRP